MIMIDILWNNRAIWHRKHYVTSSIGVTDNTPRRRVELLNLVVRPITLKRSKLLCYLSQSRHDVEIKDLYSLWNIDHVSFSQINQVLCIMLIYGYKNWSMFEKCCFNTNRWHKISSKLFVCVKHEFYKIRIIQHS